MGYASKSEWVISKWKRIFFSDKCWIEHGLCDNMWIDFLVQDLAKKYTEKKKKHLVVWRAIWGSGKNIIILYTGKVNSKKYQRIFNKGILQIYENLYIFQ